MTWYQEGDSHFSSFLPASYSEKEKKYFDFFFPSSGRLNSEGVFTVVKFCISKWNQTTLPKTHASSELTH